MGVGHGIVVGAAIIGMFIFFILAFALGVGSDTKDKILCVLFIILGIVCAIIAFKDSILDFINKGTANIGFLGNITFVAAIIGMFLFFILAFAIGISAEEKWEKALTVIFIILGSFCAIIVFKDIIGLL